MGSFNDEYNKLRKKRLEEQEETKSSVPYQRPLNNSADNKSYAERVISGDIAPVKTPEKEEKWYDGWFKDGTFGGSVADLFQDFGTGLIGLSDKIIDGLLTLGQGLAKSQQAQNMQSELTASVLTGEDPSQIVDRYHSSVEATNKSAEELIKKDLYDEKDITNKILSGIYAGAQMTPEYRGGFATKEDFERFKQLYDENYRYLAGDTELLKKALTEGGVTPEEYAAALPQVEKDSVFDDKSDSLIQSAGQLAGTAALQTVGVPWWLTSGTSAMGSETESALLQGATIDQAAFSGLVAAGAEVLTEKIGGISFGGKTFGDVLSKKLAQGISSKFVRAAIKLGIDAAGEGFEEVLTEDINAFGRWLSYQSDKDLAELLYSEEAMQAKIDAFLGGAALGGNSNVVSTVNSFVQGVDPVTEYTKNEQAVVDKVYKDRIAEAEKDGKLTNKDKSKIYNEVIKDLEKGYISTDTIEEVLGGEDYTNYKNELKRQQDIDNELNELRNMKSGEMTDIQIERMAELKGMTPNTELVNSLKFGIDEKIRNALSSERNGKGSYLFESYNEQTRRGQAFEADLSKYDSKQAEVIKKAIDSGILNNTNRTHDFVDMVAKISADKGVLFDFANNAKLKESGFAVDGKFVNGYVTKDGITVNIDSNKALNSIVGHEITHVLEGTELYAALKVSITEYAKSKGEYQSRLDELTKLYEGVEDADVSAELTADLVGDYLFTDEDFINHLSTTNRNVFQKIYDEIKYLYKVATAGSKQARELEKVKRAFDKAYREGGKASSDIDTKYSIRMTSKMPYNEQLQLIEKGRMNGSNSLYIGNPSNELQSVGFSDAPFAMNQSDYRKSRRESAKNKNYSSHAVPYEFFEKMSQYLSEAPMLIDNGTKVSIVSDYAMKDTKGNDSYVIAGVWANQSMESDTVNQVKSVYPLDDFIERITRSAEQGKLVLINKNKAEQMLATIGIQPSEVSRIINLTKSIISQNSEKSIGNTKFSLSDSDGKQLTKEQSEYFKDSKMRDDNGNLKVMYHGSQDAGFHTFDSKYSDDDTSFFFVDRNDVATSYSGTSETYAPKAFKTVEDANKFFAEIDATEYEVIDNNGKYTLLEDGDEVATSDDLAEIYEEWRDWSGLGYGDANYKVYLNLTNPLVVDGKGRPWNKIDAEFSQEVYDKYQSLTAEEKAALVDLAEWEDFRIFNSEIQEAVGNELASAYAKMGENINIYDLFSVAADKFSEESMRENARHYLKTRDFAQRAKEGGYDGVIFKNIIDNGGYSNGDEGASTVAIAFESNQIKSVANDKPTKQADIRYSLSDSEGTQLTKEQQEYFKDSKIRNENGSLKVMHHGSFETFTVFDKSKAKSSGTYGKGFYFTDSTSHAATYGKTYDVYLNITNPLQNGTNDITKDQIRKFVEALAENEDYGIENYGYDATIDSVTDSVWGKSDFGMILDLNISCVGNMVEAIELFNEVNGTDYNGIVAPTETVAFYPNQIKLIDNKAPTADKDIRYSLSETDKTYLEAVKRGDMETAQQMVYDAAKQAGYTDDMSYKMQHSAPNSKDDVSLYDLKKSGLVPNDYWDHPEWYTYGAEERESFYKVKDALSKQERWDAEGKTNYKGEPIEAKIWVYRAVDKTVNSKEDHFRNGDWVTPSYDYAVNEGQMNPNGYRIIKKSVSIKDLYWDGNSIAELGYDDGKTYAYRDTVNNRKLLDPVTYDNYGMVIPLSKRFKYRNSDTRYSLSDTNEAPTKKYGNFNVYGKDVKLDIAPVGVAENAITTEGTVSKMEQVEYPEGFAPVINSYTIEQEIDEIGKEIESLVEESTDLYNKGEEAKAMELLERINELSTKDRQLREKAESLKVQEEAEHKAYMDSLADAEPPVETERAYSEADTTPLDDKTLKVLTRNVRNVLSAMPKENKAIREVIEKYSTSEQTKSELFRELKDKFGDKYEYQRYSDIAEVKKLLRTYKFNVSDHVKGDIADFRDYKKSHNVRTSKNALSVDVLYEELSGLYPGLFPADITNETDRFERISEVSVMPAAEWVKVAELSDNEIMQAVDFIHNEVTQHKNNATRKAAEANARAYIDDIAPSRASEITKIASDPTLNYQGVYRETPIKTVKERLAEKLSNVETELANNKRLRADSVVDFNREIARLQEEYNSKANKNTKAANDILRRIERLQTMKNNVDADYEKRIGDLEAKAEKMNSATYQTAKQRQSKTQEYAEWAKNLIGDTTYWVDKKLGISYKVNTLKRNLRDVVRDAQGNRDIEKADAIYDELQGTYNHNEAELNRESNRIKKVFADMKITSAEDAYIQMLGEFMYNPDTTLTPDDVNNYYEAHKSKIDKDKVNEAIKLARANYDGLLERVNEVLREQGMKEIPYRKGYFPHFTETKQSWLAKLFNWKTQDTEIPTSIAGLTEQFTPNRSWQSFNKQRFTDATDYSFTKGFDTYVQGALDWIYHIEDIQKRRAFENELRYIHSEKGIQDKVEALFNNEEYDADELQEQIDLVYAEARNPLNNFVTDLHAGTNKLASKKSSMDRGMEELTNRKFYSTMTNLSNRVSANMVGGSVSSALTNFIPITQSWGEVSPVSSLRAMGETIRATFKDDGVIDKSDFLTNRLKKSENLYKTTWDKITDKAAFMMEGIDYFTSQTVWRSKYLENIANGMSESEAIKNADQFAEGVMAGRSRGNQPTLFDSKNPLIKTLTAFQLEVNNQYGYMFKDMPQDVKNESTAKLVKGYAAMFIGAYAYNALYSALTGRDAAFDPIRIVQELLGDLFDEDEEKEPIDAVLGFAENVAQELPFVGGLLGGGRVPISSALPYDGNALDFLEGTYNGAYGAYNLLKGPSDELSEEEAEAAIKGWESDLKTATKEWLRPLYYLAMPMGGGQLKKTIEGLSMFSEDHPIAGSYTDSGSLRFPVDDTLANRLQAGIFGQYASQNARDYFDNDIAPLNEKQTQEFIDSDMTIQDYWNYREGLSKYKTLAEKADYINSLDLTDEQKNILINNIADRKEDIDMSDYDNYGSFEEFDYAQKNPEKYEFWKQNGISYEDYASGDEDTKAAYNWAFENPDKFTLSKVVASDVVTYRQYTKALNDIKADKDEDGKSISGSRKEKVIDYVNNLDADYGSKIILFKSEYPADDTYNYDIIDYLNNREDISYKEMETILKELGFTVDSKGNISWD